MGKNEKRHVIVLGSGHLASRLLKLLRKQDYIVEHVAPPTEPLESAGVLEMSALEKLEDVLSRTITPDTRAIFIVADDDRRNIELVLAASDVKNNLPIFVTLFNDDLAANLRGVHEKLHVVSPAKVVAPFFAKALLQAFGKQSKETVEKTYTKNQTTLRMDWMIAGLVLLFLVLWLGGAAFFRWSEGLSWVDALYFVATTITTVGYGDFNLRYSETTAKLVGIFVMFISVAAIWTTFSLVVDRLIKQRELLALGKKKYTLKNHLILCGLGRIGYGIVAELLRLGKKILVIEQDPENRFLDIVRSQGVSVFVGDATLAKNLHDAGAERAAGLFSVINDDLKNLEVGLNSRTLNSNLPLVLRIFDGEFADDIKEKLSIEAALSTSTITATHLANLLEKQ